MIFKTGRKYSLKQHYAAEFSVRVKLLGCIYINFRLRQIKESRHGYNMLLMCVRSSRTSVLVK